jgi:D-proline reductase (dithiol) PrdB
MTYVRYIDKTREYYLRLGYEKPYRWAHFDDAPFTPLKKPLAESRLALISTSEVAQHSADDQRKWFEKGEMGNVYSIPSDTPLDDLYSQSTSFDKYATSLDDVNAYFPITRLHELAAVGRIGEVGPNAHALFNAYSQRRTREVDAPEVLARCRADAVDVALMVPV